LEQVVRDLDGGDEEKREFPNCHSRRIWLRGTRDTKTVQFNGLSVKTATEASVKNLI